MYGESQQKSKVFTLDKHPEECGEVKVAEEYQGHTPGHLYLKQLEIKQCYGGNRDKWKKSANDCSYVYSIANNYG